MATLGALIEYGVATQALPGQTVSGDAYVAQPGPEGMLVAVMDGLGHGEEAATASRIAIAALESCPPQSVVSMLRHCHERLLGTRGVVMSLALLNEADGTLTWVGVGNVEGWLLRGDATAIPTQESLLLRGGVLGRQLPPPYASIIPLMKGDTLIFATDGIRNGFPQEVNLSDPPQKIADAILAKHNKRTDDALVLVVRYRGSAS
jgi:phosphoserine phosphatase RsbX